VTSQKKETAVTKTQAITAISSLALLLAASIWFFYGSRTSHEIVVAPVQQGAQR
jgi:hypothetical protein